MVSEDLAGSIELCAFMVDDFLDRISLISTNHVAAFYKKFDIVEGDKMSLVSALMKSATHENILNPLEEVAKGSEIDVQDFSVPERLTQWMAHSVPQADITTSHKPKPPPVPPRKPLEFMKIVDSRDILRKFRILKEI
eukprot:TRINITY_DN12151_c0_g1_i1.p1 TRINITY_DN12151_c0_g1~~TRINITY_DN12151_c0_g1_i1.p1  ORF type:complete len:138 (-),score=33.81 TRINITY_DN12151_c0_g1_i1:67-480(-)